MFGLDGEEVDFQPVSIHPILSEVVTEYCYQGEARRIRRIFNPNIMKYIFLAVGFQGQNSLFSYGGDLDEAKSVFEKK